MFDMMKVLTVMAFMVIVGVSIIKLPYYGKKALILAALGAIFIAIFIAVFISFSRFEKDIKTKVAENNIKNETIVLSSSIGKIKGGAHGNDGALFFSSSFTSFETSKGIYRVIGTYNIIKGAELEMQLRASGKEFVCYVENKNDCMRLASK